MNSESNPFQAPVARLQDYGVGSLGSFIAGGRLVPASHGYYWLRSGWEMFRTAPGTWIGIALTFMAVVLIFGSIPLLNIAVNLVIPVFIGGISIGCRAIEEGRGIRFAHLFAGFARQPGALLLVGLLYLLGLLVMAIIIGVIAALTGALAFGTAGRAGGEETAIWTFVVSVLAMILVFTPLAMAVWLAPPLVVLHELSASQAIRASLRVALRNFPPFLLYGVLVLLAAVLASLPFLLGWLVLLPVLYASLYAAFRDLFFSQ
ncbi:BPSS1780 family membrane protein [Accumulibacter sp.]|uniref:BPSS1780 family membrane protein n=1 Tax=Accumulibacter sp. TaxID=2053492 RepID=UPI0025C44106|nr:BPSS1780 family membrane protein [Accumulibacter sp.]